MSIAMTWISGLRSKRQTSPPSKKNRPLKKLEYLRGDFLKDMKYYRPKAIKLGLDLQGGMFLGARSRHRQDAR